MKLELKTPITAADLANALRDDQGTFLCQQGGQNFLVTAQEGHSIKSGPTPVGRRVQEVPNFSGSPEAWIITKISNDVLDFDQAERVAGRRA